MEFNLAQVFDAVARAVPGRDCVVQGTRRQSYADTASRASAVASALRRRGLGAVVEREHLAPHLSGQDHVALLLHNCPEYLETMLGCFAARSVPFNVNHRYVADELLYVLRDAEARAIVFHARFAATLHAIRDRLPSSMLLWQVPDDSGAPLLDGAEPYESVLEGAAGTAVDLTACAPDDVYLLYTGGTTGPPKGVLWRQADIFVAALGGRRLDTGEEWRSLEELADAAPGGGSRLLPTPPLMHGAAQWLAFNALTNGDTIVLTDRHEHFDADHVVELIDAEGIEIVLIVGDAAGRPLAASMERHPERLGSLLVLISGGAPLSPGTKDRLLAAAPTVVVVDGLGASEAGQQARLLSVAGRRARSGVFAPDPDTVVLSSDRRRVLADGETELGWLARTGRIPLGYLGDPARSASTFPVVGGARHAVPGDRARWCGNGTVELLGRDAATINTGGEKVFAEEVERALLAHDSVVDCVVAARPSTRWGQEVVAVVQLRAYPTVSDADLLDEAGRHLARYKLPKAIVRVPHVERTPSGKADYRWAAEVVGSATDGARP